MFSNLAAITSDISDVLLYVNGSTPVCCKICDFLASIDKLLKSLPFIIPTKDPDLAFWFSAHLNSPASSGCESDIISLKYDLGKEILFIAYLNEHKINLVELEKYLKNVFEKNPNILENSDKNIKTNLRRVIRIYDYLKGLPNYAKKTSD